MLLNSSAPLEGDWTLTLLDGPVPDAVRRAGTVPARVPGCVHTDLLAASLIPDPYLGRHEADVQWIGRTAARYRCRTRIEPPAPDEHVDLVFDGVDTVATITVNGRVLGETADQHRVHRYEITELIGCGNADIVVDFAPQLTEAYARSEALGPRPQVNAHPFNAVRKMACNFGWDWGPDLVTAGLWRPVRVVRWSGVRLGDVRLLPDVHGDTPRLTVVAPVVGDTSEDVELRVRVLDAVVSAPVADGQATAVLDVPGAEPWWPRGHGGQPLYEVTIELVRAGSVLERLTRRTGFRSVRLDTAGGAMTFEVNGRPIWIRGANWIPEDCFPSRVDRDRYAAGIERAVGMGVNLLRVWGGGIYEDDAFFDVCDELGVLTWQDFLFACAAYAEEEPLRGQIVAEVRDNVARLSRHPSLVLWNGNNENLWGHEDWAWKEDLAGRTWGAGYYHDLLPALVAELDPTRPYTPGSPWSVDPEAHPNDAATGSKHVWDVWNERDHTAYRDHRPRFVAEFGYQGPPTWATLTRALGPDELSPASPGMLAHQKAEDGNDKLHRGIAPHLPVPDDFGDWHWAMQLQQARAVRFGLDHFRSLAPLNSGTVVWQLNDCWPVTSWAAVDGDGRRKPLWYAIRSAYADRVLSIQPDDAGLALVLTNDTDEPWTGVVDLGRLGVAGEPHGSQQVPFEIGPRANRRLMVPPELATPADPGGEFLVGRTDGAEPALWYFVEDLRLRLPDELHASAHREGDDVVVEVSSPWLTKDVTLLVDRVCPDAVADRALVTVLPGTTETFRVHGATCDPAELIQPEVLRSANRLFDRRSDA